MNAKNTLQIVTSNPANAQKPRALGPFLYEAPLLCLACNQETKQAYQSPVGVRLITLEKHSENVASTLADFPHRRQS